VANPVVELENVRREYLVGDQVTVALDGVDLVIELGEFVSIVVPYGSGKSTIMNLIG
jgi:putative ABC transport system ATP-binding protein